MQAVFERGYDAEVAAATAKGPEQVRVLVGGGAQHLALRGHHFEGQHIVAGEPVLPCKPAHAAAQRQACDAGLRDHACRHGQAEDVRLAIQFAKQHARLDAGAACPGVDMNALHTGQVDDDAAVAQGAAAHVVSTAAYRHEQPVVRAKRTAAMTSARPEHRAISPGRLSMLAFQILRADSYSASPSRMTAPRKAARNGSSVAGQGCAPGSVTERVGIGLPPAGGNCRVRVSRTKDTPVLLAGMRRDR